MPSWLGPAPLQPLLPATPPADAAERTWLAFGALLGFGTLHREFTFLALPALAIALWPARLERRLASVVAGMLSRLAPLMVLSAALMVGPAALWPVLPHPPGWRSPTR